MKLILTKDSISKIIIWVDWNKETPEMKRDLNDLDEVVEASLHLYNIQHEGTSKFCHFCSIPLGVYAQEAGSNCCFDCLSH
jgi:hypothetical protein